MALQVCLGTMTWGIQNTEEEAHEQLDYALKERGVNFIDIAEMYPVPSSDPRWVSGTTEAYVGTWLAKNAEWREKVIIATKVCVVNGWLLHQEEWGGNPPLTSQGTVAL